MQAFFEKTRINIGFFQHFVKNDQFPLYLFRVNMLISLFISGIKEKNSENLSNSRKVHYNLA